MTHACVLWIDARATGDEKIGQCGVAKAGVEMAKGKIAGLLCWAVLTACTPALGQRAIVTGAGPDDLLKLRGGPGLGYKVILGLPDGTALTRHGCVTEVGQLWCRVSLANAPAVSGYVSADYLSQN